LPGDMHVTGTYLGTTMAYGAVRKIARVRNAYCEVRDERTLQIRHVPMLLTSKIGATVVGAATAPYLWPLSAFRDVRHLEVLVRGEMFEEHGIELRSEIDYWLI